MAKTSSASTTKSTRTRINTEALVFRAATLEDVPALRELIEASVRGLQGADYTPSQVEGALGTVYGTDRAMISDGTYFVVEHEGGIVACGGWSKRRTAFGSDHSPVKDDRLLDPQVDAAKIRAFFVHPTYARQGLGTRILKACEDAAETAGFTRFELTATLTGVPLYARHGYVEVETVCFMLPNGEPYSAVRMRKP
jgi:GNAT superfamily N-acetyltransferase